MARYGISIEKEITFRGVKERISNTYYYELGAAVDSTTWVDLAAAVQVAEEKVHATGVAFKLARVWEADGSPVENEQVAMIDLTGNGKLSAGTDLACELAVLVEWECARDDIRGRKVYLRKFIRSQGLPVAAASAAQQRAVLDAGTMGLFKAFADDVEAVTLNSGAVLGALTSPSGRFPLGVGNGRCDPFIRNRNIRR